MTYELLHPFLRSHLSFVLRAKFDTIEHWLPGFSIITGLLRHHVPVSLLPHFSVSFAGSSFVPSFLSMKCPQGALHLSGAVVSFMV